MTEINILKKEYAITKSMIENYLFKGNQRTEEEGIEFARTIQRKQELEKILKYNQKITFS